MTRKHLTILLLLIITLTAIASVPSQSVPPTYRNTIIVDINGEGDYINIQDAVGNATPTDVIRIKPGIYQENNLHIDKKIVLIGDNSDTTIIDCTKNKGVTIESSYVEIYNVRIINTREYGIYINSDSQSCIISSCVITTNQADTSAILIRAPYTRVSDCLITGKETKGIGVKLREHHNIITDCTAQRLGTGILALVDAHDNRITSCNLLENRKAIDIRINSNDNIVTDCNIYSNTKGIQIWQESNNNQVYHNNFYKNDNDATGTGDNAWSYNGKGNYWDDYRGVDNNSDGIGDTPYNISESIVDHYPVINKMISEKPTKPSTVRCTSDVNDTTPTFTWEAAYHHSGIKSYYVKIDDYAEQNIGNSLTWTSPYILQEGTHIFYVRAESTQGAKSSYALCVFTVGTPRLDSDNDGWKDEEEERYNTDPYDPTDYPIDTDGDDIPDIVDTDDDNDGLTDLQETFIGSNKKQITAKTTITIEGKEYYLVDTNNDGIFDIFYNPRDNVKTTLGKEASKYLIDTDGDNQWEYTYNPTTDTISTYTQQTPINLLFWIPLILVPVIAVIMIFFLWRRRREKQPTHVPEKAPPAEKEEIPSEPQEEIPTTEELPLEELFPEQEERRTTTEEQKPPRRKPEESKPSEKPSSTIKEKDEHEDIDELLDELFE